jgi:hypothetical protein
MKIIDDAILETSFIISISLSAVFNLFITTFFYIGSSYSMQVAIAENGILILTIKRFIGSCIIGTVFSLLLACLSGFTVLLSISKNWSEPRRVFILTMIMNLFMGLLGSFFFYLGIK